MPDKASKEQKKKKDKKLKQKDKKKNKEHRNRNAKLDESPPIVDEIVDVHPNAALVWSRAIEKILINMHSIIIIRFTRRHNIEF